jgi:hypothetical protein
LATEHAPGDDSGAVRTRLAQPMPRRGESCLSNSTEGLVVPILVPAPLLTVPATGATMV